MTTVAAFLAVAMLAYLTPGPDWFVVLRRASSGRRHGTAAAAGVHSGLVVHVVAAAAGVSAVLVASAQAFTVLKLVGAGYLAYLGISLLWSARRGAREAGEDADPEPSTTDITSWGVYRQAFLANVLNPKAALFFVAVLPQFLSRDVAVAPQVLALGGLDIALGLAWWMVFVLLVGRAQRVLSSRRGRVAVDAVAGLALTGMGGALALTGRRA